MQLNKGRKRVCSVNREGDLLDFEARGSRRQGLIETYVEGARIGSAAETRCREAIPVVIHGLCTHK
jgi:hypothetical protein